MLKTSKTKIEEWIQLIREDFQFFFGGSFNFPAQLGGRQQSKLLSADMSINSAEFQLHLMSDLFLPVVFEFIK